MEGFNPDMFKDLLSKGGANPMAMVKMFMGMNNKEMFEKQIENIDMLRYGSDLLAMAVSGGHAEIVDCLLGKGMNIMAPPETVGELPDYRRSPYIIQAVSSGDQATVDRVMRAGAGLTDSGCVCLSRKRKNIVVSNVIGAAAWNGSTKILKRLLKMMPEGGIDLAAIETADKHAKVPIPYVKEFARYTPIQLAAAGSGKNLECVKLLLQAGANYACKDDAENNLLHVASQAQNFAVLEYLVKNADIQIWDRNSKGQTPLNVCEAIKFTEGVKLLQEIGAEFDQSQSAVDSIYEELLAEERKAETDKAKRAEKKKRNKVNRIAKAEGLTKEEAEIALKKAQEERAREAELVIKREQEAEAEAERQAVIAKAQKKEETKRLREELARQEQQEAIEAARQRAEERRLADQKRKEEAALRQEQARERAERAQKRSAMRSIPRQAEVEEAPPKERVKSVRREREVKEEKPAQEAPSVRRNSKSVRRGAAVPEESTLLGAAEDKFNAGDTTIFGLGGELAMKNVGRHTKKKLLQSKQQEEEDAKATRERMKQNALDRAAAKKAEVEAKKAEANAKIAEEKAKLEEERREKKREADKIKREKKKAEKAAAAAKEAENTREVIEVKGDEEPEKTERTARHSARTEKKDKASKADENEAPNKEPVQKKKADKTKMVYKPKEAAAEKKETVVEEAAPAKETPKPVLKETQKQPKEAAKPKETPREDKPAMTAEVEKVEEPVKSEKAKKTKEAKPVKTEKPVAKKEPAGDANLKQMILQKESDMLRLEVHLEKKDVKIAAYEKEIAELKSQLDSKAQGNELKTQVTSLNEDLKRQKQLNRLQATQIIEFEEALWQANKARDEAEQGAPEGPGNGRAKQVQMRDLQSKVDAYQGKAKSLNFMSKGALSQLEDELKATLANISLAM